MKHTCLYKLFPFVVMKVSIFLAKSNLSFKKIIFIHFDDKIINVTNYFISITTVNI